MFAFEIRFVVFVHYLEEHSVNMDYTYDTDITNESNNFGIRDMNPTLDGLFVFGVV